MTTDGSMTERAAERSAPLRQLSRDECLTLLATTPVGRLGVSIDALPVILPVNFALVMDTVVIRTSRGSKLDAATHNAVVAFEADSYDPWGTWGWSVLVRGVATEISDKRMLDDLHRHPLRAWAFGGHQPGRYLGVHLDVVSGRLFGEPPEWACAIPPA